MGPARPNWSESVDVVKVTAALERAQEHAAQFLNHELEDREALQLAVADIALLATVVKDLLRERGGIVGDDAR